MSPLTAVFAPFFRIPATLIATFVDLRCPISAVLYHLLPLPNLGLPEWKLTFHFTLSSLFYLADTTNA